MSDVETVVCDVETTMKYVVRGEKATFHPGEREKSYWPVDERRVTIHDIRPEIGKLSFERNGFVVVDEPTDVTEFTNPDELARYRRQTEALVQRLTGADKVVSFGPMIRTNASGAHGHNQPAHGAQAPHRHHQLAAAGVRRGRAAGGGVAALRHDGYLVAAAEFDQFGYLGCAAGQGHRQRPALVAAAPVQGVGRGVGGVGQQMGRADQGHGGLEKIVHVRKGLRPRAAGRAGRRDRPAAARARRPSAARRWRRCAPGAAGSAPDCRRD